MRSGRERWAQMVSVKEAEEEEEEARRRRR